MLVNPVLQFSMSVITDAGEQNALTELSKYSGPSDLPSSEKLMEYPQLSQSHLSSPPADATFSQESNTSQRILVSCRSLFWYWYVVFYAEIGDSVNSMPKMYYHF